MPAVFGRPWALTLDKTLGSVTVSGVGVRVVVESGSATDGDLGEVRSL